MNELGRQEPVTEFTASQSHFRLCTRLTEVYCAVMLSLFPLFTGLSGYLSLQEKKYFFFVAATVLWLISLIVSHIRFQVHHFADMPLPETLAFVAICIFVGLRTGAPWVSGESGRYDGIITFVLYAIALGGVTRYGRLTMRLLSCWAISYSICCVIALVQLMGYNALWLYPWGLNYYAPLAQETGKFLSPLGNIDVFSALHCITIPVLGVCAIYIRGWKRVFLVLTVIIGAICLVASGVASGVCGLGITAAIFIPEHFLRQHFQRVGIGYAAGVMICLAALLIILTIGAIMFQRFAPENVFPEIHVLLRGELRDEFGSSRIRIWREVIGLIRDHPLWGIGPDRYGDYSTIRFERYSETLDALLVTIPDNPHNEFLTIILYFGLVGFLPFCVLLTRTLIQLFRTETVRFAREALTPAWVCYLLQAFFNIGSCIVVPCFLIVWGQLLADLQPTENYDK